MPIARPLINVYSHTDGKVVNQTKLPAVMLSPIRPDIVQFVHTNMAKNKRQPYAVSSRAGHQTSAVSWGTGRAVARIPRVAGGGTSRSGQGAFGNMCRKGRMFGPTKIWRKWHRKINTNQKRYAVASALAASSVTALVMARGHRISKLNEIPLVIDDKVKTIKKTKEAYAVLDVIGASPDVDKVKRTKKVRAGKGKMRNRRYVLRKGPLIIYDRTGTVNKAFRNLPGVELVKVDNLSVLNLAPGGHLGRLCIWTRGAFEKLDKLFGTGKKATMRSNYILPKPIMTNADLNRIINSDEIQSRLRPKKSESKRLPMKKNPLTNKSFMNKLNPYAKVHRKRVLGALKELKEKRAAKHNENRGKKNEPVKKSSEERALRSKRKAASRAFYEKMNEEGKISF
jgi:large subunit ribosomal protein L4e